MEHFKELTLEKALSSSSAFSKAADHSVASSRSEQGCSMERVSVTHPALRNRQVDKAVSESPKWLRR